MVYTWYKRKNAFLNAVPIGRNILTKKHSFECRPNKTQKSEEKSTRLNAVPIGRNILTKQTHF